MSNFYQIAKLPNYHSNLQGNNRVRIFTNLFDTIEEAQTFISRIEDGVYLLDHNEHSRPDYYIVEDTVARYIDTGRDQDLGNYEWESAKCTCGVCDTCCEMLIQQDREYIVMHNALTESTAIEQIEQRNDLFFIDDCLYAADYTNIEMLSDIIIVTFEKISDNSIHKFVFANKSTLYHYLESAFNENVDSRMILNIIDDYDLVEMWLGDVLYANWLEDYLHDIISDFTTVAYEPYNEATRCKAEFLLDSEIIFSANELFDLPFMN